MYVTIKTRLTKHLPIAAAMALVASAFCSEPAEGVPALPVIPERIFKITDHGAVGDGKTLATDAIQKTIKECSAAGGGTVLVPAGQFLTGPLELASQLRLKLEKDAVLKISNDLSTYPQSNQRFRNCITASKAHDIEISGQGTIDGQGEPWWTEFRAKKDTFPHRPYMVVLTECTRVLVKDVTLVNSPSFHLVPGHCTDVTIDGVTITAPKDSPNTDAIDPSGGNFLITRCKIDVGDDNIAVKASGSMNPAKPSCTDFTITNCAFLHGHGLSIGGQSDGGLRGMHVSDCTFEGTTSGIRMKASREKGGLVEDVSYENITMKNVKTPIYITGYYPKEPKNPADDPAQPGNTIGPIWRNITISNLTVTDSPTAGIIWGVPELPVSNVKLNNVSISAKEGMKIYNAKGIQFTNSTITVQKGEKVLLYDAQVSGL
jgi:polygalacturonase